MTVDVLAVGAHPDDVEIGCGGCLALLAESGRRVGILHLTSGEAGTRGTAEERRREAEVAAEALGVSQLRFLNCGDGGLRTGREEEDALVAELRESTPRLVLGPAPDDRHPDHGRAASLVRDACFYAGLVKREVENGAGAHRPEALFAYMQHDSFEPSFIVDVTRVWEKKMRALDAYRSQIWSRSPEPGGSAVAAVPAGVARQASATKVSSREFRLAVEGRAAHFGLAISSVYGEPFLARGPLGVRDPWSLLS